MVGAPPPGRLADGSLVDVFAEAYRLSLPASAEQVQAVRSSDGGRSWSAPLTVAQFPYSVATVGGGHPVRASSQDVSAYAQGRSVYVSWERNGSGRSQIGVAYSTDAAHTWTQARDPVDGPVEAFLPEIAADSAGRIAVSWYQTTPGPGNPTTLDVGELRPGHAGWEVSAVIGPAATISMSQEWGRQRHVGMREHDNDAVVVIGAGLAGLTAAATAARAGRPVIVVEAHAEGGRARTDERNGYRFNQGPHALYKGGQAWRILCELGVPHHGHLPPLRRARVAGHGKLVRLLSAPLSSLTARLLTTSPAKWAGRSAEEWAESLGRSGDVPDLARMLIRVSTYVADLEHLPADLAISQMKMGLLRGVSYLDGGWASLVNGLTSAASAAGATVQTHHTATGINAVPGGWEVALAGGESLPAAAVVIAAGGPASARKLLPIDPGWPAVGPPVTAACLDLGLRDCRPGLLFGLDEPLYLSRHCPPGDLAPSGGSVVHVMRYGARDARLDRAELRRYAGLAGIGEDHIVEERFLASMVVTHLLPTPEHGLAGRPGVEVPGADGVYLAGDWVGPSGWLADAAMASGQRAGLLAVQAGTAARPYPRVA